MKPDRDPDGFDCYRRAYLREALIEAAQGMPDAKRRAFTAFLKSLHTGKAA